MFTKAQIAKLPAEDQEVLAQMELSKARRRQKLLEQARGLDWRSRYFPLYIFTIFMAYIAFYYFNSFHLQERPGVLYLLVGMMSVSVLIFQITRINRRLDALLELQDFDRKNQDGSNHSKAD